MYLTSSFIPHLNSISVYYNRHVHRLLGFTLAFLLSTSTLFAQKINYDEALVPVYELPELLKSNNGTLIKTKKEWENIRKPELLEIFSSQMYGRTPSESISVQYEQIAENTRALGGKATIKQIKLSFSNNNNVVNAILLLVLPNQVKGKVPIIVGYNYKGNHSVMTDSSIIYSENFKLVRDPKHQDWIRGIQSNRWDFEQIIQKGYAVATMCYHDIFPDQEGFKAHSIAALFSDYPNTKTDAWEAIGAWAWGSSRIVDYLETLPYIDQKRIAILGHSRHGKAALWAAAQDPRFNIVIANNSGEGGASLAKRKFGETIAIVSSIKPFWFAKQLNQYHHREEDMPFDQHMLLALIAPRPLYVASAENDLWADPKGEYLALYYASPIYALYRKQGLTNASLPKLHQPILQDVGYHIRAGIHDVNAYDWYCYLKFLDQHAKK
ncbi:acetylxylan esterase [Sphingobacterium sp. HJSM2_6]|uniref:glucuronyl esterase domain-containing protein n=1 Tax=Sphingobacterium sp. HJSM2_6 TaxID=3366264 RepID=UPI003BDE5787